MKHPNDPRRGWLKTSASALALTLAIPLALPQAMVSALAQPAPMPMPKVNGYPAKPITLVVPSAAGGGLDVSMRHVAKRMQESLGVPVVVDNRPSVNLLIGTRQVAAAAPDGYTLLAISNTFIGASLFADAPGYDPFKDFVAISPVAQGPNLMLVNTASGINSPREFVEKARKAGTDKLTFGSAGVGSSPYIAAALLAASTNTELQDVPYKGAAPAMVDLIGGRISLLFDSVSSALPQTKSGTLKALAVTTAKRSTLVPDIPTVAEALNLPDYDLPLFYGIAAPAQTPPAIVNMLHEALSRSAADPSLREQLAAMGFEAQSVARPDDYTKFLREQFTKFKSLKQ
ncbi:tripartite tricarboxylate transporter substrate binding protein [soil metagenome]